MNLNQIMLVTIRITIQTEPEKANGTGGCIMNNW